MTAAPTILVFDSGLGGLTVHREIVRARPDASYVYVADDAFFPYGNHSADALRARLVPLLGELIDTHRPDLVVIACNTASTLVLPDLRARYAVPFVGTVPAIKPACAASSSGRIAVLGTEATVSREYTRQLILDFAGGCRVDLVGSARLAACAEAELRGEPVGDDVIAAELAPCFRDADGRRTDTVVLACTHFPLLLDRLVRLAPWPVRFLDPAPAIARRVVDLLGPPGHPLRRTGALPDRAGASSAQASGLPRRAGTASERTSGLPRRAGAASERTSGLLTRPGNPPGEPDGPDVPSVPSVPSARILFTSRRAVEAGLARALRDYGVTARLTAPD